LQQFLVFFFRPKIDILLVVEKYREQKDLSRLILDHEMDMSISGYSKIERNEVDLTVSKVQKIAEVLGVDVSQILNYDATQIFNVSGNQFAQGLVGAKAESMNFYADEYKDKYIKMLEEENARLKQQLKEKLK
jgi:transcriptional regulator with XRE-family HTH domain